MYQNKMVWSLEYKIQNKGYENTNAGNLCNKRYMYSACYFQHPCTILYNAV